MESEAEAEAEKASRNPSEWEQCSAMGYGRRDIAREGEGKRRFLGISRIWVGLTGAISAIAAAAGVKESMKRRTKRTEE